MKAMAITCPRCHCRIPVEPDERVGRWGGRVRFYVVWSVQCHQVRVAVTETKPPRGRHHYRAVQYWLRRKLGAARA